MRWAAGRELAGQALTALTVLPRARPSFDEVERYCAFVGYPRSGHSLVGSLLDAHPDAVIAHELDAVRLVQARFPRSLLFSLILHHDAEFTAAGRQWTQYNYTVPNQWQGRHRRLRVIGDKKGGVTTLRLAEEPHLLDRLRRTVRVPLRLVHVVRNPFDNVATMARRRPDRSIDLALDQYLHQARTVARLRPRLDPAELVDVRHEDLIADPPATLRLLCDFLDLDVADDYLRDCASIVRDAPHRSREAAQWPDGAVGRIEEACASLPALDTYAFSD